MKDLMNGRFLSSELRDLIINQNVDQVSILNPAGLNISGLSKELKEITGDECVISNYDVAVVNRTTADKRSEKSTWELMNSVIRVIKQPGNCLFVIRRGAAIHQHIMWLCAQISSSSILELTNSNLKIKPANLAKKENFNPLGKKTLGAFPSLYIDECLNKNQDTQGWFGASDLSQIDGALASGLSAAIESHL